MDFWDEKFSTTDYVFGEGPNAFLARQADRLRGYGNALAVADGEGRNGVWLAEQGLDVLSVDASSVGLAKADDLAKRRGVTLTTRLVDIGRYDWPAASFDVVAAIFVQFAPPAMRDAMFAGMMQTLKPGGLLLLEGYTPRQLDFGTGGPKQLDQLYTEELLREKFAALEIVELAAYEAELEEGSRHIGTSALIDLVARKRG
ncbi:MAG: class I SAM-dependent methyltransferase [Candidatus Devosia phytovorans]|uniref:Class I SAM-dependent methyltransferase n=1 Tax=Candidatus Devosia phytovorans TaxID=3121372 RepID=A0AAJ5VUE5_9HYPH|nr:class I SAM-dependent methyltransferase [Devosia sp.]WEK05036.1 MAG: class I SAM-dependent methyltransferase [Devosia sp.]